MQYLLLIETDLSKQKLDENKLGSCIAFMVIED
jgi:hypothetical protein